MPKIAFAGEDAGHAKAGDPGVGTLERGLMSRVALAPHGPWWAPNEGVSPVRYEARTGASRCSRAARGSAPTTRSTSAPLRMTTRSGIDIA